MSDDNDNNKTLLNTVYVVNNNADNKESTPKGRVRWVSIDDDSSGVSRTIIGAAMPDARIGFPVTLNAKYDKTVNTSLKACAIALPKCANEHNKHAACEITFRDNRNELSICCKLLQNPSAPCQDDSNVTSPDNNNSGSNDDGNDNSKMIVSKKTDYKILAGAIANRIRNHSPGTLIRVAAVGPECVFIAARAIAVCGQYLEQNDGSNTAAVGSGLLESIGNNNKPVINLVTVPRFTKVRFEGRQDETNVLELCVFSAETVSD